MFKFFLYILGVFLVSLGIFFTIIYLNLLRLGYSLIEFGKFIIRKPEFWLIIIGIILILLALERRIKNELWLRHHSQLERKKSL